MYMYKGIVWKSYKLMTWPIFHLSSSVDTTVASFSILYCVTIMDKTEVLKAIQH